MSLFLFLSIVQAIVAAALVGVVLMQRSEGGGLGLGGGGSPGGLMSARGAADFLTRTTKWLAVLFVMIGNHYPLAFASRFNWLIFALILVIGAVIRHFYNTRHQGLPSPWWACPRMGRPPWMDWARRP